MELAVRNYFSPLISRLNHQKTTKNRPKIELTPLSKTKKESPHWSNRQTPGFVGCLSCFQLYPFIVVKVNVFINKLLCFLKGGLLELPQIFLFEVAKEVLHGSIVPTVATSRHARRDVILLSKDIMNVCEVYW